MGKRILAMIVKEFHHILRDPRTLAIVIVMPIMMVFLYGYALNMDIKHLGIGVVDYDRTPESRALVRAFDATEYFDVAMHLDDARDADARFRRRELKAVFVIPRGYAEARATAAEATVQLLVDGSDPTVANAAVNYANAVALTASTAPGASGGMLPIDMRERFHFNPDLEGSHFIIPGVVTIILMMVCALLTSITVAREKETGTMDILLVSPVRPVEIILGKVAPYIVLAFMDALFILVMARYLFDVPFRGSLTLLLGLSVLYVYCALGIGLFISSMAATQQVAMMAALVATILPSIILSGFIFPIFTMPAPIRALSWIVPARHFMEVIRGILLKACTPDMLVRQTIMLAVLGTVFVTLATVRFTLRARS